jgi:hypothetical protein
MAPSKISRFENVIQYDTKNQTNEFWVKVWYLNQNNENILYQYNVPAG